MKDHWVPPPPAPKAATVVFDMGSFLVLYSLFDGVYQAKEECCQQDLG